VTTDEPVKRCQFDESRMVHQFDATLAGCVDAIPPVVERIMRIVGEMGCAGGKEFDIEIALNEALANAVEHGCQHDPSKEIQVRVECDPEAGMLIIVRDPGSGFDPARVRSPVVGEQIFTDHGRGIFLIDRLMDEVRYERGGTEIWMRKK